MKLPINGGPDTIVLETEEELAIFRELVARAVNTWEQKPEMVVRLFDFLHGIENWNKFERIRNNDSLDRTKDICS